MGPGDRTKAGEGTGVFHERLITPHPSQVGREERARLLKQRGAVLWFTGLSGSGKSTLAHALERRLFEDGRLAFVLDGDNIRGGLNRDLGFSPADREENIRRISEVAALFADAGVLTLVAFISPYRKDRRQARQTAGTARFVEIFLDPPLAVCEERDPKGLYRKARAGGLPEFTGVGAPYERPENPELVIDTGGVGIDDAVALILSHLTARGLIGVDPAVSDERTPL